MLVKVVNETGKIAKNTNKLTYTAVNKLEQT